MGSIYLESSPPESSGIPITSVKHLYLVYRENDTDPYDGWNVIRGRPSNQTTEQSEFGDLVGIIDKPLSDSADAYPEAHSQDGSLPADRTRKLLFSGENTAVIWQNLVTIAEAIVGETLVDGFRVVNFYNYNPFSITNEPPPTINSNSFIASVLQQAGFDAFQLLNDVASTSIGVSTRLGTFDGDTLRADENFTTLIGGWGEDTLIGSDGNDGLYGGSENDVIFASMGVDIIHGGESQRFTSDGRELNEDRDGRDTVDYSTIRDDVSGVIIESGGDEDYDWWITKKTGSVTNIQFDFLYSIERVRATGGDDEFKANQTIPKNILPEDARYEIDLQGGL